jgi:hypothetical protein
MCDWRSVVEISVALTVVKTARLSAEELFHSIWPKEPIADEDTELLIDLAMELDGGMDNHMWNPNAGVVRGGRILQDAWNWNQTHKTGKWKLYSLAELAKALRSDIDRNLLAQMNADEGRPKCDTAKAEASDGQKPPPCQSPRFRSAPLVRSRKPLGVAPDLHGRRSQAQRVPARKPQCHLLPVQPSPEYRMQAAGMWQVVPCRIQGRAFLLPRMQAGV